MNPVTTNYGLLGGKLDATRHIVAAIPRLLNATEGGAAYARLELIAAATTKGKRGAAARN